MSARTSRAAATGSAAVAVAGLQLVLAYAAPDSWAKAVLAAVLVVGFPYALVRFSGQFTRASAPAVLSAVLVGWIVLLMFVGLGLDLVGVSLEGRSWAWVLLLATAGLAAWAVAASRGPAKAQTAAEGGGWRSLATLGVCACLLGLAGWVGWRSQSELIDRQATTELTVQVVPQGAQVRVVNREGGSRSYSLELVRPGGQSEKVDIEVPSGQVWSTVEPLTADASGADGRLKVVLRGTGGASPYREVVVR